MRQRARWSPVQGNFGQLGHHREAICRKYIIKKKLKRRVVNISEHRRLASSQLLMAAS